VIKFAIIFCSSLFQVVSKFQSRDLFFRVVLYIWSHLVLNKYQLLIGWRRIWMQACSRL